MSSAFVTTSMGGEAYAQWVRRAIARARNAGGRIVPLFDSSVEEPVELLRDVVERGFRESVTSKYQSVFVNGNPHVVTALAQRYRVNENNLLTTTGATSGLSLIYRAYLKPGDHILVESPGFDLFGDIGRSLGAEVEHFSRHGDRFTIDEIEILSRIRPGTRLIVLSDLHNPSGMLIKPDVIARLARFLSDRGVLLVVDEVYGDYADAESRVPTAAALGPNVIAVNSLTKIFGLSTLRCGWIIASPEVLAPIRDVSEKFEFGVSKLAHAVAALVLAESDRFSAYSKAVLQQARPLISRFSDDWISSGLVTGPVPDFGCTYFPKICGIEDTLSFSEWLADHHGVIVAPGEFFDAPGHIRIGFAHAPDVLEFGLSKVAAGIRAYSSLHAKAEVA